MIKWMILILSIGASVLEKTLFDEGDIHKSMSLVDSVNTGKDYLLSYFLKRLSGKLDEECLIDLILTKNEKNYFGLIYSSYVLNTNEMYDTQENIAKLLLKISKRASGRYLENCYNFRPKVVYKDIKKDNELNYIITMVYTLDKKSLNLFFNYLDVKKIFLGDYIPLLEYLAGKNIYRAYGYLGEAYYYGINVKKSIDTALDYFLKGKIGGDPISYNGIGKILMSGEYEDFTSAKQHLDIATSSMTINETDYLLYLLYKKYFKIDQYSNYYLSRAVSLGYLPAICQDGENYIKKGDYNSAIIRLSPIIDYDKTIIDYQNMAYKKFCSKNYKGCLLILLLVIEMGSESSLKNAIYLLENYKILDNQDKFLFDLYIYQTKYSNENLNRIGDCYFYGRGVLQSYKNAFSYYLTSASMKNTEGLISLSYMYEKGLGTQRDFYKAFSSIQNIILDDDNYLLLYYIYVILFSKILLYSLANVYALVTIFTGVLAYKMYKNY
jgi:uncharacterized protein